MGVLDGFNRAFFGSSSAPQNMLSKSPLGKDFQDFLRQRLNTPALEDPRLQSYLDAAMVQVDRTFDATVEQFESNSTNATSGDVAKIRRDLAIARSRAKAEVASGLIVNLEALREQGVFPFLAALQDFSNVKAQFRQADRLGNHQALAAYAEAVASMASAL